MGNQRNNRNSNWKVNCERVSTEKRDEATDGDNAIIFNVDTNTYEAWDGEQWATLSGEDNLRYVNTVEELNDISSFNRRKGIIIGVDESNEYYRLKNDEWTYTLADWELLSFEFDPDPRVLEYDLNEQLFQVINHNLGYIPSYVLLEEDGTEFETKVTHDLNNIYIRCDFPLKGKIYLK